MPTKDGGGFTLEVPEGWDIRLEDGTYKLYGPVVDDEGAVVGEHPYGRIPESEVANERQAHFRFILAHRAGAPLTREQIAARGY